MNTRISSGRHNALQVAVVERFIPRFSPGAVVLYFDDAASKHVVCATRELQTLNVDVSRLDRLPDVVLYDAQKNWLFLIDAAPAHGPVNPERLAELEALLSPCTAERVYITALPRKSDFRRHAADIAWGTNVWIAETPDHMVHFNGQEFLGPHTRV